MTEEEETATAIRAVRAVREGVVSKDGWTYAVTTTEALGYAEKVCDAYEAKAAEVERLRDILVYLESTDAAVEEFRDELDRAA